MVKNKDEPEKTSADSRVAESREVERQTWNFAGAHQEI